MMARSGPGSAVLLSNRVFTDPKDDPVWKWDVDEYTMELFYNPNKDGTVAGLYTTDIEADDDDDGSGSESDGDLSDSDKACSGSSDGSKHGGA